MRETRHAQHKIPNGTKTGFRRYYGFEVVMAHPVLGVETGHGVEDGQKRELGPHEANQEDGRDGGNVHPVVVARLEAVHVQKIHLQVKKRRAAGNNTNNSDNTPKEEAKFNLNFALHALVHDFWTP